MTPYEQVITEEAAKWFPDSEDLLIWAWDEDGPWCPGTCPPLDVVAAWEDGRKYPPYVRRVPEDFLRQRLENEWALSRLDPASIPELNPRADATGRRAWRVDLSECPEEIRLAVGRATMRGDDLPAWDFDWENLANPEFSNTGVISTDDGRYLYEPWKADLMSIIDELRPEPDKPSYFMLLYRNRGYIQVWVHPEGVFTEIRFWHDIVARRFTHWRASSTEAPVPCRSLGGIVIAEENLLPLSVVMELAIAFHSYPSVLPTHPGVFWHVTEEAS
jgi:hypothetical protein